MGRTKTAPDFLEELARFLASGPSREQLLGFRPSKRVQRLAEDLLQKQNDGDISFEEKNQLDDFASCERLLRLIKARLHADRKPYA